MKMEDLSGPGIRQTVVTSGLDLKNPDTGPWLVWTVPISPLLYQEKSRSFYRGLMSAYHPTGKVSCSMNLATPLVFITNIKNRHWYVILIGTNYMNTLGDHPTTGPNGKSITISDNCSREE